MTNDEFAKAQIVLAERDNEIAALVQTERECVEQVRVFANGRRDAASRRAVIEQITKPLRNAVADHAAEMRRLYAEKAKAEALAKAAEPQPPSPLELLTAQVQKLTEQLAAKQ